MNALRALYRGDNDFDIVGKFRIGVMISLVLVAASVAGLFGRGLNLGIDFEGGVAYQVPGYERSVSDARSALRPLGLDRSKIQILGTDTLRVQTPPIEDDAEADEVREVLAELSGTTADEVGFTEVGPSWGDEVTRKAVRALVFFLIAIALYITLRFEWRMAIAALVAVFHDVLVTVGIYAVFQFEVTPATVIAFLTILGYSLYDTIVVFDKVDENLALLRTTGRGTFRDTLNLSMNEVMMRSVNTSLTSILPIASMLIVGSWILGAATLEEFAVALLIGLLTGAYSSVFTASPVLGVLKGRESRFRTRTPSTAGRASEDGEVAAPVGGRAAMTGGIQPRARKKRRR